MGLLGLIELEKIREVSEVLGKFEIEPEEFVDEKYYPPRGSDQETTARYFFFMVAIDHRTSRPGRAFEGFVDGEFYHGADLLYRLGSRKLSDDPEFFSPENMAEISERDVRDWLTPDEPKGLTVPDPELRALILRDAALKLLNFYGGEVKNLIDSSRNRLYSENKDGFIDRLKVFKAYEDPVEKKSFLLAKFLLRRGLINFVDLENLQLPIDNHLTRIALRLGIVRQIDFNDREFSWEEDVAIRLVVRRAYKEIASLSNLRPDIMDDFLWMHGRTCCVYGKPRCDACRNPTITITHCPFRQICNSYKKGDFPNEHPYLNTWYY